MRCLMNCCTRHWIKLAWRSKVLQFVVYVPSAKECPLYLQHPDGGISKTNAFISSMWGGVLIWNPPDCSPGSRTTHGTRKKMSSQELMETLEIFIGELRQLFGLKPSYCSQDMDMSAKFVVSEKGFTECLVWPILKAVLDDIQEAALHLGAYECYFYFQLRSLPRMIVIDEIGKQVELSLEASSLAQRNATLGISDSSAANFRTGFPACAAGGNQRAETLQERAKYSAFLASWAASS